VSGPLSRRSLLRRAGLSLLAVPACAITRTAAADANAELRTQLQYQPEPKDGLRCSMCLEFIPGKDEHAPGGCKLIPGDDEISPDGWCTAFNSL
jgi:hypothetical protein